MLHDSGTRYIVGTLANRWAPRTPRLLGVPRFRGFGTGFRSTFNGNPTLIKSMISTSFILVVLIMCRICNHLPEKHGFGFAWFCIDERVQPKWGINL